MTGSILGLAVFIDDMMVQYFDCCQLCLPKSQLGQKPDRIIERTETINPLAVASTQLMTLSRAVPRGRCCPGVFESGTGIPVLSLYWRRDPKRGVRLCRTGIPTLQSSPAAVEGDAGPFNFV